jgi:hypothetical protein
LCAGGGAANAVGAADAADAADAVDAAVAADADPRRTLLSMTKEVASTHVKVPT